ncbi:MAG TPA: (Fe-S)-binding protein [Dehalococcoidales bacterium]|nr:(Fe-S)-binding protein [Dehalococcoidales bacterium]
MADKELIPPGLNYLADNITSKHNILGASRGEGAKWAKGLNLPEKAETIFFAGCGYQYASELESLMSLIRRIDKSAIGAETAMNLANFQKKLGFDAAGIYRRVMSKDRDDDAAALKDAIKVLKHLGVEVGYLADNEPCCGGLLYYMGLHKEFGQNARQLTDGMKSSGVKRIISIIPSCTNALRKLIPDSIGGSDIEVKHFCEVVLEKIDSLELRYPRNVKVAYHDPCQLSRYMKLVDEPRRILRAIKGIELVETKFTNGDCTTCCGGGGGFEAVFPELSQILAVNRAKELLDTGAEIIITQCPGCIMQLKEGVKELKATKVEVLDLAQILATAMGLS